jgi:hypothetical protein
MKKENEITPEQIVEEVTPAGTAYVVSVKKNDKIYKAYLKEADKKTISQAFSKMRNVNSESFDIIEVGEMVLRKCFIGGDVEILSDDKLLISASIQCYNLIEVYDSEIKKI